MASDARGDDELRTLRQPNKTSALNRVRLPIWVTAVVAVVIAGLFLFLFAGKDSVELGPGVHGAETVTVSVCYPAELAATNKLDIIKAEQQFRDTLTKLGARSATVRIERTPDCSNPPLPNPGTTSTTRRS